ncbi:MAG TPA: hypothetical protein PLV58_10565, partial [Campylobacterales bacterium]|nr:hypothetical protein [Campylobacterales bacterium]
VFDVVALKADGSVESGYASDGDKSVTVDIVEDSGGACAAAPIHSQNLLFSASDHGKKAIPNIAIASAHKKLRCRVTDLTNPASPVVGCSSDTFSIRPATFSGAINGFLAGEQKIATPSTTIFAKASDNATNTLSYNAVLDKTSILNFAFNPSAAICESNTTDKLIDNIVVSFTDGVSSSIDAKFKDIGVFDLNLTDSTWTLGDECIVGSSSNTQDSHKYGCNIEGNISASIGVYQMKIDDVSSSAIWSPKNWKYKANSLADQNASYRGVVKAQGKDDSILKNFSKSCFAEDTSVVFRYSLSLDENVTYRSYAAGAPIGNEINASLSSGANHINFVVAKDRFGAIDANGSSPFNIDFGARRDFNIATNPTKLTPIDFNTTNSAFKQLGGSFDANISTHFLYGKIYMPDYIIDYNGATQTVRAFAQFYENSEVGFAKDNNMSKALGSDKWWINRLHSDEGNITNILVKTGDNLGNNNTTHSANFSINQALPHTLPSGVAAIDINMSAAQNIDQKIKLHLEVPEYLWHGSKVQSFTNGSDYSEHPSASIDIFGSNENAWIGNGNKTIKSAPKGKRNMKINW